MGTSTNKFKSEGNSCWKPLKVGWGAAFPIAALATATLTLHRMSPDRSRSAGVPIGRTG